MFEDPRLSTNYVDAAAIRRYNFFKGFVLIALIALLLGLFGINRRFGMIDAPSINAPTDVLEPGTTTLVGSGAAGSTVEVFQDGASVGTAVVTNDGSWTLNTAALDAGEYEFTVRTLDGDGDLQGESSPFTVTVEQPVVVEDPPDDGVDVPIVTYDAPSLQLPDVNELDRDAVTISGDGTAGSTVELYQDGELVGTADVDDDGNWSVETAVSQYVTEFEAEGYDPDGNSIGTSGIQPLVLPFAGINIDTPQLGELTADGDGNSSGALTLSGVGEPGATIELSLDGEPFGTTTVSDDGTWSFTDNIALPSGDYQFEASQILEPDAVVESVSSVITVPEVMSVMVALDDAMFDDAGRLSLNGTGTAGESVDIIVDGEVVDTVTVGDDGTWSWTAPNAFTTGDYDVQVSLAGDMDSATDAQTVSLDAFVELGDIGVSDNGDGSSDVVLSGRTVPNGRIDIYIDGELVDNVNADENGDWTYSTTVGNDKSYLFDARLIDNSGADIATAERRIAIGDVTGQVVVSYAGTSAAADDAEGAVAVTLAGTPAVEVILDASWSMTQALGNGTRYDAARDALTNIVNDIVPENTPFALRVFGNVEGNFSCRTDLMVEYGVLDRTAVNAVINSTRPQFNANTPIAQSLALVAEDLAASNDEERIIVLLTDGEETCDGDPAAAIQQLIDDGFEVQVNIVGLAIADDALKAEFERWAELGGGTYYDVTDPSQLVDALEAAIGAVYLVNDASGSLVAIGRVGDQPISLPPGTYSIEVRTSPSTMIEAVEIVEGETVQFVLR